MKIRTLLTIIALSAAILGCDDDSNNNNNTNNINNTNNSCDEGLVLCGESCFDLQTDAEHCGSCDTVCTTDLDNASPTCVAGQCAAACLHGFGDCNGDLAEAGSDGCELDLSADDANCGACALTCGDFASCSDSVCSQDLEIEAPCESSTPTDPHCLGTDRQTVFRFRSTVDGTATWQSEGTWSGTPMVTTYSRLEPLSPFAPADFDGATTAFLASDPVAVQEVGYTVSALFNTRVTSGTRMIASTNDGDLGFELKLFEGLLRGYVTLADGSIQIGTPAVLPTDTWVFAHLRVRQVGTMVNISLYVDGLLVGEASSDELGSFSPPATPVAVGARFEGGVATDSFFDGEIYSVEVRNWPVAHRLLNTPQLRDGGPYLGRPAYHDYLDGTADSFARQEDALYLEQHADLDLVTRQLGIPYLNDNYIPQGFAVHETTGNLFMAYYYKDETGANPGNYPSIVVEADPLTGDVLGMMRLMTADGTSFLGHVGGIGVLGDNLYVGSDGKVYRFDLTTATEVDPGNAGQGPAEFTLEPLEEFETGVAEYLDISPAEGEYGALYVGVFVEDPDTDPVLVKRYELPVDGTLAGMGEAQEFTFPEVKVQGVTAFVDHGHTYFLFSQSYGDHISAIYLWDPSADEAQLVACLPAGLEDLDLYRGQLWGWFENGSTYMQKRGLLPWDTFYPYVVSFDREMLRLGATVATCEDY